MKHRFTSIIIITLYSAALLAQPQQVISSAGGSFENSFGSISFTVGEFVVTTLSSDDFILTQGFQQTKLTIVDIQEKKLQDINITAYPNPTKEFLNLKIDNPLGYTYRVYDMSGRIIRIGEVISTEFEISFTGLAPSVYLIKLYQDQEEIRSLKIIKR